MKVATILGTRPEIIRLACIIKKLDEYFEHILIHTGQNFDPNLNDIFFSELCIRKPDYHLNIVGKNLGESMGNVISSSYDLLQKIQPNCILILGDTNSALSAISAKRLKIPIFHMEAGNRCFDQVVPEEINRKIVDHISDINLPYTEHSRRNLLAEGLRPDHIIVTGSPLTEVYNFYSEHIMKSNILANQSLSRQSYILFSIHREENIDIETNWKKVIHSINTVAITYRTKAIIVSTHPRTRKKIIEDNIKFEPNIVLNNPFGLFDYLNLQKNAYCVISDSGTISEEAILLNVPAISFRICTERPEAIDSGGIILSGLESEDLLTAINVTTKQLHNIRSIPVDYSELNVSDKVVRVILSYVPVINKVIWKKN